VDRKRKAAVLQHCTHSQSAVNSHIKLEASAVNYKKFTLSTTAN
jgi:hypothetical protein